MSKMFVGQIEIDTNWNLGHNIFKGKLENGCLVAVMQGRPHCLSKDLDILLHMSKCSASSKCHSILD